ncbi:cell division protein PerM [Lapillicoccus jejuensis]|uniref:Uncharacterized protein n=1 Tax=Lapillicoccus jejuensis TaxID=402171 RepID=A0A542E206_9MICO|nr:DUF6350 family protein [Lapillicoccus jejuensis]TQJ09382.1 hypothetical protein FB458_2493 [Lapillicoccus jejuensis]
MSLLQHVRPRPSDRDAGPSGDGPPALWTHLLPGVRAAGGSWLVVALAALLGWVVAPLSSVSWLQAVGVASAAWGLAHGLPVGLGRATLDVAPLGLTVLAGAVTARAVRRTLEQTHAAAPGTTWGPLVGRRIVPGFLAGYLAVGVVAWLTTLAGPARPPVWSLPLLLWVPLAATAWVLARRHGRGEEAPYVGPALDRAPRWVARALLPGVRGAGLLLLAGLLVVLVAVLARIGTVTGLQSALAPGAVGGAVLLVAQLLVVPDLAVWALAWLAGPGFTVAQGSTVTLTGAHPGLLPMLPVLGALPTGGDLPGALLALLAVPVLVGAVVSWLACRDLARLSSWRVKATTATAACGVSAALVLVAGLLAGGSLGVQRLAQVGPSAWLLALAVLGELLVGAALHVGVDRLLQHRR